MARGQFLKKDYLNCTKGKWRMKVSEGHPDAKTRIEDNPSTGEKVTLHEVVYDFISGTVKKIWTETHEKYGSKWCLQVHDGDDIVVLNIPMNSGYASATITKLLNADITKPIKFVPYYFEEEKKSRMVLYQDDQKVESLYTKDSQKDFPIFPASDDQDDINLWKIQVNKFLKNKVKEKIIPKLPDLENDSKEMLDSIPQATSPSTTEQKDQGPQDVPFPDDSDDLPF